MGLGLPCQPITCPVCVAADKAVSLQQGLCYRWLGSNACTLPLAQRITKQICCCSRVGKAWGSQCEKCPLPGTGNLPCPSQCWHQGAGGWLLSLKLLHYPFPFPNLGSPVSLLPQLLRPPEGSKRGWLGFLQRLQFSVSTPKLCRGLPGDLSCWPRLHLLQLRHPSVHEEG